MGKGITFLGEHPLQMPHSNSNGMQLIHAIPQPMPESLSSLSPSSNVGRSRAPNPTGTVPASTRNGLHVQRHSDTLSTQTLILIHHLLHSALQFPKIVENLQPGPNLCLVQPFHSAFQNLHRLAAKQISRFPDPIELFVDGVDADEVVLVAETEDLEVELGGLGEIEFFGVRGGHEVAELLREAEGADGVLEELRGAVEVGELGGFGGDGAVRVGELGAEAADGGLERGERGSEGGEGVVRVVEGRELREEIVMPREDFGTELVLEEADRVVELLGGGGRGAGGEGGGGEGGGGEGRGEEGGEDGIRGQGV